MKKEQMLASSKATETFFNKSTACFTEEESSFTPTDDTYNVAQQIGHTAHSIDWFLAGAFDPDGFDMNFDQHDILSKATSSLAEARKMLAESFANLNKAIETNTEEDWSVPMAEGPVMGGLPRYCIFSGIEDHTAHHRGALTVYARLCGKVPQMPYGDM